MVVEQPERLGVAAAGELDERDDPGGLGLVGLRGAGLPGVVGASRPGARRLVVDRLGEQPAGDGGPRGRRLEDVQPREAQGGSAVRELSVAREHGVSPSPAPTAGSLIPRLGGLDGVVNR